MKNVHKQNAKYNKVKKKKCSIGTNKSSGHHHRTNIHRYNNHDHRRREKADDGGDDDDGDEENSKLRPIGSTNTLESGDKKRIKREQRVSNKSIGFKDSAQGVATRGVNIVHKNIRKTIRGKSGCKVGGGCDFNPIAVRKANKKRTGLQIYFFVFKLFEAKAVRACPETSEEKETRVCARVSSVDSKKDQLKRRSSIHCGLHSCTNCSSHSHFESVPCNKSGWKHCQADRRDTEERSACIWTLLVLHRHSWASCKHLREWSWTFRRRSAAPVRLSRHWIASRPKETPDEEDDRKHSNWPRIWRRKQVKPAAAANDE